MESVSRAIRRQGMFLRRRDLLGLGYSDRHIRFELGQRRIFRVRQGWYSVPDAPEAAVLAVRVGGRLTGVSALESYGLRVPRRPQLHVAVPIGACRLRKPLDRFRRLTARDPVRVHWNDRRSPGGTTSRVSVADALLVVLTDRKSTRLNSSHVRISYAVFCLKKKNSNDTQLPRFPDPRPVVLALPARLARERHLSTPRRE